jgi:hypothetical protein
MKTTLPALLLGAALAVLAVFTLGAAPVQDMPDMSPEDMAAMLEKMAAYTQPGENHQVLERLLGEWDVTNTITMMPGAPSEPGRMTGRWLFEGRWLVLEGEGQMMGQPFSSFFLLGYDNLKQSFVVTSVTTLDTAMTRSEGDLSRDGQSLVCYGTMDEYLTGEHDKMVKYAWRFVSDDEIVIEVHDLHIGETGSQVVETRLTRAR